MIQSPAVPESTSIRLRASPSRFLWSASDGSATTGCANSAQRLRSPWTALIDGSIVVEEAQCGGGKWEGIAEEGMWVQGFGSVVLHHL